MPQEQKMTLQLERRPDGGLRICGVDGPGGALILSCAKPEDAFERVWPALISLMHPITQ